MRCPTPTRSESAVRLSSLTTLDPFQAPTGHSHRNARRNFAGWIGGRPVWAYISSNRSDMFFEASYAITRWLAADDPPEPAPPAKM
jgi:hypothetical protein